MTVKQKKDQLQICIENGTLQIQTAHPKAGEKLNSSQLPGIVDFFHLLSEKMGLTGELSASKSQVLPLSPLANQNAPVDVPEETDTFDQPTYTFLGTSKNGEETTFSHNRLVPGMPFELTITTTKTMTAKNLSGKDFEKPFGQDVRTAMKCAGLASLDAISPVTETVQVITRAKVDWFPEIIADLGTTYQISKIIDCETTRQITFFGSIKQDIPAAKAHPQNMHADDWGSAQNRDAHQNDHSSLNLEKLFVDMPKLNSTLASNSDLLPSDNSESLSQNGAPDKTENKTPAPAKEAQNIIAPQKATPVPQSAKIEKAEPPKTSEKPAQTQPVSDAKAPSSLSSSQGKPAEVPHRAPINSMKTQPVAAPIVSSSSNSLQDKPAGVQHHAPVNSMKTQPVAAPIVSSSSGSTQSKSVGNPKATSVADQLLDHISQIQQNIVKSQSVQRAGNRLTFSVGSMMNEEEPANSYSYEPSVKKSANSVSSASDQKIDHLLSDLDMLIEEASYLAKLDL